MSPFMALPIRPRRRDAPERTHRRILHGNGSIIGRHAGNRVCSDTIGGARTLQESTSYRPTVRGRFTMCDMEIAPTVLPCWREPIDPIRYAKRRQDGYSRRYPNQQRIVRGVRTHPTCWRRLAIAHHIVATRWPGDTCACQQMIHHVHP
jgi:hypothetical protein